MVKGFRTRLIQPNLSCVVQMSVHRVEARYHHFYHFHELHSSSDNMFSHIVLPPC
ncbi:hypothetical protein RSAG8_04744, partial [Rhizoctonia solani AG-8 WAC10335]